MGTSRTPKQLAGKLDAAGKAMTGRVPLQVVKAIVAQTSGNIVRERAAAVGADGKLSHAGRTGARLGFTVKLDSGTEPSATVTATGPWQLIENPTDAHAETSRYGGGSRAARQARAEFIGPQLTGTGGRRAGRSRKVRNRTGGGRRAVLNTPFGYRRSIRHPGTRGKRPWRKAMDRSKRDARREVNRPVREALAEVFR